MTTCTYYFISDLHIGGDEALGVCDFESELVSFLQDLANRPDEDVELIIVGDANSQDRVTGVRNLGTSTTRGSARNSPR